MAVSSPFRLWADCQQTYITTLHLVVLVVFVFLADLQFCDSVFGPAGHRGARTTNQVISTGHFGISSHNTNHLQPGSRHAEWNHEVSAAENLASVASRRYLARTTRARADPAGQVVSSNSSRRAPLVEVEALTAFKAAITSDPLGALKSWIVGADANDSDVCTGWAGITCSPLYPYHVIAFSLPNRQLVGNLAEVPLGHLPFLQRLDLSMNFLTGSIHGESLGNCSLLASFNMSFNVIMGEIPAELGELASLQDLDFRSNNLTGFIPESLGNCSSLRFADFGTNSLQGNLPSSLGKLSNLASLYLDANEFLGSIPGALGNCTALRVLNVSSNLYLEGEVPVELSQLKRLQELSINTCSLDGTFPVWIGNLTRLVYLSMSYNDFVGEIPATIGQLEHVSVLFLGGNELAGEIPLSITNCTSLTQLGLESNQLTGHLPPALGLLTNLLVLLTAGNNFTGVIPASLSNCSSLSYLEMGVNDLMDPQPIPSWIGTLASLETIYLSQMNLEGDIPKSIGQLPSLEVLAISQNNLSGTIPASLQNCTYLYVLDVGWNQLSGELPSELGLLGYMYFFSIALNALSGSFPSFIGNWTELNYFDANNNFFSGLLDDQLNVGNLAELNTFYLGYNEFEGPIPDTLGNSSSIFFLYLTSNRLSGTIPASLGNMSNLEQLYLDSNQLQGAIPVEILTADLPLGLLELSNNFLEGSIPSKIGQLSSLQYLGLSGNNFTGIVPGSLGNCSSMIALDLSYNRLEGSFPAAEISTMAASLISLNISDNLFSGSWPVDFRSLSNLQRLNVSANNFSGSIPLGLGQCSALRSLDISLNDLTGAIPTDIGSLKKLEFLNASFNDFQGPVPQSGIFNSTFINADSFLGNPGLCGSNVLLGTNHQECPAISSNVTTSHTCRGFKCKKVWIPVATAIALLGVVLIVVGIILSWTAYRSWRDDKHTAHVIIMNFASHVRFSERDVMETISHPNGENIIGVGSKSIVYKGVLAEGEMFAIKKLLAPNNDNVTGQTKEADGNDVDDLNSRMTNNLVKEAQTLAKLRHRNILKILSFYSTLDVKALILEYMPEGSLHKHLHEMETSQLMWQTRFKIAMGVAQGMAYLHHDFPEPVIHRDLKPSNILLDADFEPKVGDFGISKFVNPSRDGDATASTFCGTIGYMPPEYASVTRVSTKGDVYSYGMVLLELLTRRRPTSESELENYDGDLRSWVMDHFHDRPFEVLDLPLMRECGQDDISREQIMLLMRVALFCTRLAPDTRPTMADVVVMLTYIRDTGVEPVTRRGLEDLANDASIDMTHWQAQDPSGNQSPFASSG